MTSSYSAWEKICKSFRFGGIPIDGFHASFNPFSRMRFLGLFPTNRPHVIPSVFLSRTREHQGLPTPPGPPGPPGRFDVYTHGTESLTPS